MVAIGLLALGQFLSLCHMLLIPKDGLFFIFHEQVPKNILENNFTIALTKRQQFQNVLHKSRVHINSKFKLQDLGGAMVQCSCSNNHGICKDQGSSPTYDQRSFFACHQVSPLKKNVCKTFANNIIFINSKKPVTSIAEYYNVYTYLLCSKVLILNPKVGEIVSISSPLNFFNIVVFPALSNPLKHTCINTTYGLI